MLALKAIHKKFHEHRDYSAHEFERFFGFLDIYYIYMYYLFMVTN